MRRRWGRAGPTGIGGVSLGVALTIALLVTGFPVVAAHPAGPPSGASGAPQVQYAVSFVESGLPNGTWWTVRLGNSTRTTPGDSTITFGEPNGTYAYAVNATGFRANPANGSIAVDGASVSVPVAFSNTSARTSVSFVESGLPTGTLWAVTVNRTEVSSTTPLIGFDLPPGPYAYAVGPLPGYQTNASHGTIEVGSTPVTVYVNFTATVYPIAFAVGGLPSGTPWTLDLNGTSRTTEAGSLVVPLPNGTYPYSATSVPGYLSPPPGRVVVSGGPQTVPLPFGVATYPVVFQADHLPPGVGWQVSVNGTVRTSTSDSIVVPLANGTYEATVAATPGYRPSPASLSFTVHGSALSLPITFAAVVFSVTFAESGLPSNGSWTVTFNGTLRAAPAGSPIVFTAPNGEYSWTVGPVPGFLTTWRGVASVAGANATIRIAFHRATYSATFREAGLPAGAPWSVDLNGSLDTTTGTSIVLFLPNGTVPFTTSTASAEWQTLDPSGTLTISGAPVITTVSFAYAYPARFEVSGVPAGTLWTLAVNGTLAPTGAATGASGPGRTVEYILTSNASSVTIPLPNGTYVYEARTAGPGGGVAIASGSFGVAGGPPPPQRLTAPPTTPAAGLATPLVLALAAVAVVAAASLGAASIRRYRHVRRESRRGDDGIDTLYGSYELATEVDLSAAEPAAPDPLDDIF
ncbi:MAG: hypothetical protein QXG65_01585 [Thermoplasmata archaeon]